MAKKGFFRRITQAVKSTVTSTVQVVQAPFRRKTRKTYAPLTVFSEDKAQRRSNQANFRRQREAHLREVERRRKAEVARVKAEARRNHQARQREYRAQREELVRRRTPYNVRSADADERARRQRILRAKRKQIEYRKQREGLMVQRNQGSIDDRIQRYLNMNKRDRTEYHPDDAEAEFWGIYDRGVGGA